MNISLRSRPTGTGKQSLYLDFYDNGKRWYESLHLYLVGNRDQDKQTKRLAETILSQRRLDAAATENALPPPSRVKADFIDYCRKLGQSKPSKNTRLVWKNTVAHLETFAGKEGITFGSVNEGFLEDFKDFLLARVSANTASVYLARVKTACRKAASQQILLHYRGSAITIKKQKTHREYLTLEELQKLEQTPIENQAVKDAFLFACFAGLRFSDVRELTWRQVRTEESQTLLWFTQEKTGDAEALPLSPQAVEILEAQRKATLSNKIRRAVSQGAVFKLPAQQTVDKALKRWAKRACITKTVSFHVGRHTFATLGLAHGIDLYVMSKLLGHRRVETTELYARVIDQSRRDAVRMLPRLKQDKG